MAKLGDAYQEAVAQVVRTLDPRARIEVGAWTEGPDGRRDLDVAVWPSAPGAPRFVLIECKDWQRPVGIAAVDALESKRRDLAQPLPSSAATPASPPTPSEKPYELGYRRSPP